MNYLLDTNIVSETSKLSPDENCVAWLRARRGQCQLSTISLAELRYGIERLPEGKRKAVVEAEFRILCEDYSGCFIDFDGPAAAEWGRYAAELEAAFGADWWRQFDLRDTQIGAIAREYGLVVATRNARHFPFCDTENPFEPEHPSAADPDQR
jgi:predicted nucleic acid-binding protein